MWPHAAGEAGLAPESGAGQRCPGVSGGRGRAGGRVKAKVKVKVIL